MTISNLPVQLTSFTGRERELAEVERLVSTSRLVRMTSGGGCGKTQLTIQLAKNISVTFADFVWLVDLVPREKRHLQMPFGPYYPRHKCVVLRWIGQFRPVS